MVLYVLVGFCNLNCGNLLLNDNIGVFILGIMSEIGLLVELV